ncbi:hypothetical protein GTO27_10395 [Candidatus Bathyarchaeota archaeon]|nr:hypothetical protein [Candidatus Bathyarchaeota archaeon]
MTSETDQKLPISDFYKVVDYVTIFKSVKLWEAIVVFESLGRRSIDLYLWHNRGGLWKRKHKFDTRNIDEWKSQERNRKTCPETCLKQ